VHPGSLPDHPPNPWSTQRGEQDTAAQIRHPRHRWKTRSEPTGLPGGRNDQHDHTQGHSKPPNATTA
ncbi:MAG: hypothetical protein KJN63_01475, partial [Acidimicrobiia bacterium]|nr:hypothetical protein [Acidimicrobiia bacterium]